MSQEDLRALLGVNNRQTVSQIETGVRRLSAVELLTVVRTFETSIEKLTDPFILVGDSAFSWRQKCVPSQVLQDFESKAGEWIGAYNVLCNDNINSFLKLLPNTKLTYTSRYEDAAATGEIIADQLELGERPARELRRVLEKKYNILILMVDAAVGISGAACHLPKLNAIIINRNESAARRNSDLAHEFFHILTWAVMRPEHVESSVAAWDDLSRPHRTPRLARNQRIEQLADHFGSGILMPTKSLDAIGKPKGNAAQWLIEAAAYLEVSSRNLKWRLVNSGRHPEIASVQEADLVAAGRSQAEPICVDDKPLLFSKPMIMSLRSAMERGDLSGRRVLSLLDMDREAFSDLCDKYAIERPAEFCPRPNFEE